MKPSTLTPLVLEKLGFSTPIDFDIKPDGLLVVVDSSGRKYSLPRKDYEDLLSEPLALPCQSQGTPARRACGPAENSPSRRGRKPKSS